MGYLRRFPLAAAAIALSCLSTAIVAQEGEEGQQPEGEQPPPVEGEAPAPPPPPPLPANQPGSLPPDWTSTTTTTPQVDHDELIMNASIRHLQALGNAQNVAHHTKGVWLYGDYRHVEVEDGTLTAEDCAAECEKDEDCFHWNFHVMSHRCQLKHDHAKFNGDAGDYVCGSAHKHFDKHRRIKEARDRGEF